jgi:hypothetical protein
MVFGSKPNGLVAATANLLPDGQVLMTLDIAECDFSTTSSVFYDPATGSFAAGPAMNSYHCEEASSPLADGSILIVGSLYDGTGTLPTVEIYDRRSDRFSVIGEVVVGRYAPRATLLNNGEVLITGGDDATAELYQPAAALPLRIHRIADGRAAVLHADTHAIVSADNPARADEALEIYCTGLVDGSAIPPQLVVGDHIADILYFGGTPGFPQLKQITVRVPTATTSGDVETRLVACRSQIVTTDTAVDV